MYTEGFAFMDGSQRAEDQPSQGAAGGQFEGRVEIIPRQTKDKLNSERQNRKVRMKLHLPEDQIGTEENQNG